MFATNRYLTEFDEIVIIHDEDSIRAINTARVMLDQNPNLLDGIMSSTYSEALMNPQLVRSMYNGDLALIQEAKTALTLLGYEICDKYVRVFGENVDNPLLVLYSRGMTAPIVD